MQPASGVCTGLFNLCPLGQFHLTRVHQDGSIRAVSTRTVIMDPCPPRQFNLSGIYPDSLWKPCPTGQFIVSIFIKAVHWIRIHFETHGVY